MERLYSNKKIVKSKKDVNGYVPVPGLGCDQCDGSCQSGCKGGCGYSCGYNCIGISLNH